MTARTEVQCRSVIGEYVYIICEAVNGEAGLVSIAVTPTYEREGHLGHRGICISLYRRELEQLRDAINDIIGEHA